MNRRTADTAPDTAPWTPAADLLVDAPAAVAVLWSPSKRRHLRPFIGQAASLGEAARALGLKKPAMSYWVRRLVAAGLIRPWPAAPHARRGVPRYRCVADRLRVSLRAAPLASYEAVFDDTAERWHPITRHALGRAIARQAPWLELSIEAGRPGGLVTQMVPSGRAAPPDDFLYCWGRLWLDPAEREALRLELDALWERYVALSDAARKSCPTLVHLVHVADATR